MPAEIKKKSRGSGKHGLHDAMARLADRMGNHPAYRRRNGRRENGSHSGDRRAQTGLQGQRHGDDALGRLVQDQTKRREKSRAFTMPENSGVNRAIER